MNIFMGFVFGYMQHNIFISSNTDHFFAVKAFKIFPSSFEECTVDYCCLQSSFFEITHQTSWSYLTGTQHPSITLFPPSTASLPASMDFSPAPRF